MATWYYVENNQPVGPVDDAEFARALSAGRIQGSTLVWNETMTNWLPYSQARAVSVQRQAEALATGTAPGTPAEDLTPLRTPAGDAPAEVAPIHCSECGRPFPPAAVIPIRGQWVCSGCKTLALKKLQDEPAMAAVVHYAGFWIRFAARLIDGVILFVVNLLVGFVMQGLLTALGRGASGETRWSTMLVVMGVSLLAQLVVSLCYTVFFLGRFAATPGKMACGIMVVRADGSPVTYARACGRHFADMLSGLTLLVGYLIAAFDVEKRALHDYICDTRVVYR
jgi:uncharacterized RDD family membrane protein YckC